MAKNSIRDYDSSSSNNSDVQSVDISEGCSPSGINNAIREVMADLADVNEGTIALESPKFDSIKDGNIKPPDASGTDIAGTATTIKGGAGTGTGAGGSIIFQTADGGSTGSSVNSHATAMTIADDGKVGIGTTSPNAPLVVSTSQSNNNAQLINTSSSGYGLYSKGGGGSAGLYSARFDDYNGTQRMVIDNSGNLLVGVTTTTAPPTTDGFFYASKALNVGSTESSGGTVVRLNRQNSDGDIIRFYHASNLEGSISVSGTTVSYNGGHLSRWSRLADNTKDTSIVKGTVMTNLDQMVVWSHDEVLWTEDDDLPDGVSVGDVKTVAYTEDNEQLNCMSVSSIEGDSDVSGVFVSWDDDGDYNDMNIAMTGDMVIRIASGTTVARGDLLMSAGDGTAKPQDDDIVRSKTIAKVTSTTVSHTYDDGSYLVPCVLMAC